MATQSTERLKKYFGRGCYPTEEQFSDLIDSFVHKESGEIDISRVKGLADLINGKFPQSEGQELQRKLESFIDDLNRRADSLARDIKAVDKDIDEIAESVGAADGLCPLDSGGKVSERYLPSYVDDVVEVPVISDHEVVENEQVHIYDEMPEEYKDLPTSSTTGLFMQAPSVLQCCAGKFYLIGSVYRGHSVIDYFHVRNFDGWERFGAKDSTGTVTAVSGKIYVDLSNATNDCIYRWSGRPS